MSLTVNQILHTEGFEEFRVICGNCGINREVSCVSVMDAPDIYNWLQGGEILLTSGYILKDNMDYLLELIEKIAQKGAAALFIKLGRFIDDIPEKVKKRADMDCYAPIMIIEGMSWDPISWPNTELGGLEPSTAKLPFLGYSIYKEKYDSKSKEFLADYCKKEFNSIPSNDVICGFMAVELACEAARKANSTETEDLQKAMTENTFNLAGYPYKMNETGGNGADFDWGCGQFQPKDLSKADESGDDWVTLWPEKYAISSEALTFKGWK